MQPLLLQQAALGGQSRSLPPPLWPKPARDDRTGREGKYSVEREKLGRGVSCLCVHPLRRRIPAAEGLLQQGGKVNVPPCYPDVFSVLLVRMLKLLKVYALRWYKSCNLPL